MFGSKVIFMLYIYKILYYISLMHYLMIYIILKKAVYE